MTNDTILTVGASPARRLAALAILGGLGLLLLWLATGTEGLDAPGRAVIGALGIGTLTLAGWMQAASRVRLVLTEEALMEEGGTLLTPLDAVTRSDRGPFASKPSSGFVLRLDRSVGPVAWRPGLWWRIGRRIGVGGILAGHETRAMSEAIAVGIRARDSRHTQDG